MKKIFDYIVLGAGPAGLFFAYELIKTNPNQNILIIDKGKSIGKRICPLVENYNCPPCKKCAVVYGSGGAGMYSDGKLSVFPAGSRLVELLRNEKYICEINQHVCNILEENVSLETKNKIKKSTHCEDEAICCSDFETPLMLKKYPVIHMGSEGIQESCFAIEQFLIKKGVLFFENSSVKNIDKDGSDFLIEYENKRKIHKVFAKKIIFAFGKAAGNFWRQTFDKLGVKYNSNVIEIGVRVEANNSSYEAFSKGNLDAKYKFNGLHGADIRTFCICNGGYLVSCFYDDMLAQGDNRITTISGYSLLEKKSNILNFGILVRKKFDSNIDPITMTSHIVQGINQGIKKGYTAVQRWGDFKKKQETTQFQIDNNSIISTLKNIAPTSLHYFLPAYVTDNVSHFMERVSLISNELTMDDTLLHAPVWEWTLDEITLDKSFQTTAKNIFVIGDMTGLARGIVQAASTGIIAAKEIASREL